MKRKSKVLSRLPGVNHSICFASESLQASKQGLSCSKDIEKLFFLLLCLLFFTFVSYKSLLAFASLTELVNL